MSATVGTTARAAMHALVALLLLVVTASPGVAQGQRAPRARPAHDAVVDARHTGSDGVRVGGVPTFRTLAAALAAAPADDRRHVVLLRDGRYREKLTVTRPNVTLVGESRDGTVLTYDAASDTPAPGGGTFGTRGSFTLRIAAPGFRARRLTIENAFDYPGNAAKPADDPTRLRNTQAVALMLDEGSDRAVFDDVRIVGHQDTLFANAGRAYFRDCVVLGHVDFIFGAGQAVFDRCDIVSRDRGLTDNNGYVVAPSTKIWQPFGFLFVSCRLLKETPALAPGSVLLGRPWHPSADPTAVGSAAFVDCWMDDHVAARGWERMSSVNAAGERIWFEPADARFYEYRSTGPGAASGPSRRRLPAAEVRRHTPAAVLGGWTPDIRPAR